MIVSKANIYFDNGNDNVYVKWHLTSMQTKQLRLYSFWLKVFFQLARFQLAHYKINVSFAEINSFLLFHLFRYQISKNYLNIQAIERTFYLIKSLVRNVRVNFCRFRALVTQQRLYITQICAVFQ